MRGKPLVESFSHHKTHQSWNENKPTKFWTDAYILLRGWTRIMPTYWYLTDSVAFLQLIISRFWESKPRTQGPSSLSSGCAKNGRKRTATRTLLCFLFPPSDSATRWAILIPLKEVKKHLNSRHVSKTLNNRGYANNKWADRTLFWASRTSQTGSSKSYSAVEHFLFLLTADAGAALCRKPPLLSSFNFCATLWTRAFNETGPSHTPNELISNEGHRHRKL